MIYRLVYQSDGEPAESRAKEMAALLVAKCPSATVVIVPDRWSGGHAWTCRWAGGPSFTWQEVEA